MAGLNQMMLSEWSSGHSLTRKRPKKDTLPGATATHTLSLSPKTPEKTSLLAFHHHRPQAYITRSRNLYTHTAKLTLAQLAADPPRFGLLSCKLHTTKIRESTRNGNLRQRSSAQAIHYYTVLAKVSSDASKSGRASYRHTKRGEAEGDEGLEAGERERETEREREEGLRTDPGCWLGTNQG
jgi:hypothetical protein